VGVYSVDMNEHKLIGNILAEDNDSDEEFLSRYTTTKRHVLLNKDELSQLQGSRSGSAPPLLLFPQTFWPEPKQAYAPAPTITSMMPELTPKDNNLYNVPTPSSFFMHPPGLTRQPRPQPPPSLNTGAAEFIPSSFAAAPVTPTTKPPSANRKLELSEFRGRVAEMARDQTGSRYLQQKIDLATPEEKQLIFDEIVPTSQLLMNDKFGNYVVQKMLEHGSRDQRRILADQLVGQIVELSLQTYGCRVVQRALDVIELEQKRLLIREFRGQVETCVDDQNGNHVIQKVVEVMPWEYVAFIVNALRARTVYWAVHPYGCRVIQRIIEHCPRPEVSDMLEALMHSAVDISKEPYGNYVIQHILEKGSPDDKSAVLDALKGKLKDLCKHKFAR